MVEKWSQCLDNGGVSGALLTDLSKAFDRTLHDLLTAKLAALWFRLQFSANVTKLPLKQKTKNKN